MANFTNKVVVEFTKGEMSYCQCVERDLLDEGNIPDVIFVNATLFDKDTGEQGEVELEIYEGDIIAFREGKNFNDAMLDEQRLEQIFEALHTFESEGRYEPDLQDFEYYSFNGNFRTSCYTFNFKETV